MIDGVLTTDAPTALATPAAPVRIAVLDEHGMGVETLNRWIDRNAPDLSVVAVDDDWMRLVRHQAFPPDVILLDAEPLGPVSLPARVRASRAAGASVVLVADRVLPEDTTGVAAVVERSAPPAVIADAVRGAMIGRAARRPIAAPIAPRLSAGELQALRLYASGATTAQVAEQMGVGYETVKTYLRRVRAKYAKLDRPAGRRVELVRRAREDGFLG